MIERKILSNDHRQIADQLEAIADQLRALPSGASDPGAWIEQLAGDDALTVSEVAVALEISTETVRRLCSTSSPRIGVLIANSVWLISASRLLTALEREKGKPAMLSARTKITALRRCGDHHKKSAPDVARATA
jgi:hypothetical protein